MVDQETDPEGLWQIIEETHKVNTVSKVQSVMKKAARANSNPSSPTRKGSLI